MKAFFGFVNGELAFRAISKNLFAIRQKKAVLRLAPGCKLKSNSIQFFSIHHLDDSSEPRTAVESQSRLSTSE
jgi:hypothetical protein